MIGDLIERGDGRVERVIYEGMVNRGMIETPEEEAARVKKKLPMPMISYMVVRTEEVKIKKGGNPRPPANLV